MWPGDRCLALFVGSRRIECARVVDGHWVTDSVAVADVETSPAQCLAAFSIPRTEDSRPLDVRVVVSDRWLAAGGIVWNEALTDGARAHAFVRARLAEAGFRVDGPATVRLDDAGYGQLRLAVAYPQELLAALQAFAGRVQGQIRSVTSLSVAVWGVRKAREVIAVKDGDDVIVAMGAKGRIHDVAIRAQVIWNDHWRRMQLRDLHLADVADPSVIEVERVELSEVSNGLHLARMGGRARTALDAINSASRPLAHTLIALVIAVSAFSVVLQAVQSRAQLQAARAEAALVQQPIAIKTERSRPWTRQEIARVKSVNAAVRELNLPIEPLLDALQPPRDLRVAVLSVDASSASTVRITAETLSPSEMTRYVDYVGGRPPITQAYLVHHEIEASTPEQPYRFTLEAAWRE